MISRTLFALLFLSTYSFSFGQNFDVNKLSISWEIVEVDPAKPGILVALTIKNQGKELFPASGWKLYFNYGRTISDVKGDVNFEFINGDLNSIAPLASFKGLKPGEMHRIGYRASGRAVNFRDAPSGFYLVWSESPAQGHAVENVSVAPLSPANRDGHITPEIIYQRNSTIQDISSDKLIKVLPSPISYQELPGTFALDKKVVVQSDPEFSMESEFLASSLEQFIGSRPVINSGKNHSKIVVRKVDGLKAEEYRLKVTAEQIDISASEGTGAFYAIQSLKSMFPPGVWSGKQRSITIPAVEINDAPRFGYRAFMMDVARNFQSKEQVLKVLDLMASYKLNVLHFHLNDDEGWRLEIPSLPELTEVGSKRAHSIDGQSLPPAYGSGPDGTNRAGTGYYSKSDFIEILKYAKARHIRVIPEVETPGHARAAIKSMEARYRRLMDAGEEEQAREYLLSDFDDQSSYRSVQKWNDNVMNVALPSTYRFIEKVVDEIIGMYQEAGAPLYTIHLGGDEVPAGAWEKSPQVAKLLNERADLSDIDDIWDYYFDNVNKLLKSKDLYLSGWEETALRKTSLDGKVRWIPNPKFVSENFHTYVWNNVWGWGNEDLAYRLANAGYKTILAPATNFYFDMAHQNNFDELGTYWASITDIDAVFDFVPFDYYKTAQDPLGKEVDKLIFAGKERLTDFGKSNIVGLQSLIWTELVRSPDQFEYLLAPRILAFAEKAWAQEREQTDSQDWSRFVNALGKRELLRLDYANGGFNYRIPTAGAKVIDGTVHANLQFPGLEIRYTTNGSEPTSSSKLYTGPIKEKGLIKLRVFNSKGRGGESVAIDNRFEIINKGIGGNNSKDLLNRIDKDVLALAPDLVILMVGSNDMLNSKKLISYSQYKENYQLIIDKLKEKNIKVVLMSPPPVDTAYVLKRHDSSLFDENLNTRLQKVGNIVDELATNNGLYHVDLYKPFENAGSPSRQKSSLIINEANHGIEDGIHPTKEGYSLIATSVYQLLKSKQLLEGSKKIICFGDSMTFGSFMEGGGTSEGDTYPSQLRQLIIYQ